MAKIRKINVSELDGRSPFENSSDATLPNGTLVMYQLQPWNSGSPWKLRLHDGITNGGEPFGDTGDVRFFDGTIVNKNSNESINIAPGGESTSFVYVPGNSQSDNEALEINNRSETGQVQIGVGDKDWRFNADATLTSPNAVFDGENSVLPNIVFPIPEAESSGSIGVGMTGLEIKVVNSEWTFVPESMEPAQLVLPAGGKIRETIVTENPTIELEPANAEVSSQKLIIKGGAAEEYHLHLTTGDLDETAIFLGTDDHHVKVGGITGVSLKAKVDSYIFLTTSDDSDNPDKHYLGLQPDGMIAVDGVLTKPTTPPLSSIGQAGDRQGMFAFSNSHFYYCTQNYSDGYQAVLVSGYSGAAFPSLLKGDYPEPQIGWTFVWDSVTYTIVDVSDPNEGEWQLQVDQTIDTGEGGTITLLPTASNIWKRIAWSEDIW